MLHISLALIDHAFSEKMKFGFNSMQMTFCQGQEILTKTKLIVRSFKYNATKLSENPVSTFTH